ncbi:unnamed protein product, partial [Rotaria magnacalcarata]
WPPSTSGLIQTNWSGTWHGVIEAYPEGQIGDGWHKTMIVGSYPMTDETCTTLNSTFTEHGVVKLIKDYRFCRGRDASDLYIDAGNAGKLVVQWINDVLISSFKTNGVFTVSSLRMRGDTLTTTSELKKRTQHLASKLRTDLNIKFFSKPPPNTNTYSQSKDPITKRMLSDVVYSVKCKDCEHGAPRTTFNIQQQGNHELDDSELTRSTRLENKTTTTTTAINLDQEQTSSTKNILSKQAITWIGGILMSFVKKIIIIVFWLRNRY